jgi:hypothetical protein
MPTSLERGTEGPHRRPEHQSELRQILAQRQLAGEKLPAALDGARPSARGAPRTLRVTPRLPRTPDAPQRVA